MAWMWARLHYRTTQLGYLRGGFQRFYDRMAELIAATGWQAAFRARLPRASIRMRNKQIRVETTAGDLTWASASSRRCPRASRMKLLPTLPTFHPPL